MVANKIRSFLKMRLDLGSNVQFLLDELDQLEAYVQALENAQAANYRDLAAKLLINDLDYISGYDKYEAYKQPLTVFSAALAERSTDYLVETINVREEIIQDKTQYIEAEAYNIIDELVNG